MSRVALWKRIESLRAWGYGIDASRKGYQLVRDDGLAGWELDAPSPVLVFDTVGSTMDEARALAFSGAPSGTTVLALGQSAGRGRNGGPWDSPAGGLYLSVVLRSALPPSHSGALSLEVAALTLSALEAAGAPALSFRWPNDIMSVSGADDTPRKIGGVLVEAHGDIGCSDFYIVGLGIRVPLSELAESRAVSRRAALAAVIVRALTAWAAEPKLEPARWNGLLPTRRRTLRMELWNGIGRTVVPAGFNPRGDLVPSDGSPAVSLGECRGVHIEGEPQ